MTPFYVQLNTQEILRATTVLFLDYEFSEK